MNRTVTTISVGDHDKKRTRFRLVIEDWPSGPAKTDIIKRQRSFLQELVDQPTLLACGPVYAESLTLFHDGARWVLNAEAEADDV